MRSNDLISSINQQLSPQILDDISSFAKIDYASVKPTLFIAFNALLSYTIQTASDDDKAHVLIDTLSQYPIFEEHYEKTLSQNNQLLDYGEDFLDAIVGDYASHIIQLMKQASREDDGHLSHLLAIAACLIAKVLCKLKHSGGELRLMSALLAHQQQIVLSVQQGHLFTQHVECHQPDIDSPVPARPFDRKQRHPEPQSAPSVDPTPVTHELESPAKEPTEISECIVLDDSSFAYSDSIHALHEFCKTTNNDQDGTA